MEQMQMDKQHGELREGAGLDESRINQDFIDMLQKWSSPVLFVIAAVVLAYWGWGQLQKRANDRVNEAFDQVASSVDDLLERPAPVSPVTLRAIREEYGNIAGITPMSALREADLYLDAAVRGIAPGSEIVLDENNVSTGKYAEEDMLDVAGKTEMLSKAEVLYKEVAASIEGGDAWAIHRLSAQFGLAAVAESKGDAAGAKSAYENAKELADLAGFSFWKQIAENRLADVDEMSVPVDLVSRDDLPKDPEPEPEVVVGDDAPIGPEPEAVDPTTPEDESAIPSTDAESDDQEEPAEGDG